MPDQPKEIFAFISYSQHDLKWAKWLRLLLEWYRLPSEIHNEIKDSHFLRPVFRDRDELNAGILNDELRSRLEVSKYLIVICSPNAAKSQWVSDEVKAFVDMGRLEYIIPFIVEGEPQDYSHTDIDYVLAGECLPLALRKWNKEHPERNLLGVSVFDDGKRYRYKALIRLVSRMLDVQFETLWKRHHRVVRKAVLSLTLTLSLLICLSYWFMMPVNLTVTIKDEESSLPGMEHGTLIVNGVEYNITNPDTTIHTQPLPGYYRKRSVPVRFVAGRFYNKEQQEVNLTAGISQDVIISLRRDNSFAIFKGTITDVEGNVISGVEISVDGKRTKSDDSGTFSVEFPVSRQTVTKRIELQKEGYETIVREDESPDTHLRYILRNKNH